MSSKILRRKETLMKYYTKDSPFLSYIKDREKITKEPSSKETYHIVLDIENWEDSFCVGDSLAIFPSNEDWEVEKILNLTNSTGEELVFDKRREKELTFRDFLLRRANLSRVNRTFISLLKGLPNQSDLLDPENKELLGTFLKEHTMVELLEKASITREELALASMPMIPRFYSIASSPKVFSKEVHLLVAYATFEVNGKERRGVGSHFLCKGAKVGKSKVPVYVQPSNNFSLPEDPDAPMIMIGPGTGVAPFRAFLQERLASKAKGDHWLFFGERNRQSDFYYESYFLELQKQGRLKLDTAFSRDGIEKEYVQDKLYFHKKEVWKWLQRGAVLYICGDASRMAKDVDKALFQIVKEEGNMAEVEAKKYLSDLKKAKRYLADVY